VSLLLDHNLSPRLIQIFGDTFGVVKHVALLGMSEKVDTFIWDYAKRMGAPSLPRIAISTTEASFLVPLQRSSISRSGTVLLGTQRRP